MNHFDQSSVPKQGSRKLARTPVAVTTAALIALGAWGLALGQDMRFASAEPAQPTQSPQTAQTPMGAVPLSFADLAQKVSPAVVSINVKGESEVADNDMETSGSARAIPKAKVGTRLIRIRPWRRARASSFRLTDTSSATTTVVEAVKSLGGFRASVRFQQLRPHSR